MAKYDTYATEADEGRFNIYIQANEEPDIENDILLCVAEDESTAAVIAGGMEIATWCGCSEKELQKNKKAGKSNLFGTGDEADA